MSAPDCFVDTNVLVYAVDVIDMKKHEAAQKLIADLLQQNRMVLSTQVLQEFYNIATKKLLLPKDKVLNIIESLKNVRTVSMTRKLIVDAIHINIERQFSIWDFLVISAAADANCSVIYSEDLNDGQIVNGVKIVNPFKV